MGALLTDRLEGGALPRAAAAAPSQADPFGSGMWPLHRADLLGDPGVWRQDPALVVLAPENAEDAMHVPVVLDGTKLDQAVRRVVVTIDYSPIPLALTFHPGRALPLLGFGVKYESGSPIRVSAELGDGSWAMGAAFIDALGGGCTAPAAAHDLPDWQDGFGEMRARLWRSTGRLRVALRHTQDTGLASGIPAHHLTDLALSDIDGAEIARIELHAPIEENPTLTFLLPPELAGQPVSISARDNVGYRFQGRVEAQA